MLTKGIGFGILTNVAARERVRARETNEAEGSGRRAILENDTEKRERKEVRFRKSEQPADLWRDQLEGIEQESLILAQDERWRRA